jgi:hypothetical protein
MKAALVDDDWSSVQEIRALVLFDLTFVVPQRSIPARKGHCVFFYGR